MLFDISDFEKTSDRTFVQEASSLGLPPGTWPQSFNVKLPNGIEWKFVLATPLYKIETNGGAEYHRTLFEDYSITIVND